MAHPDPGPSEDPKFGPPRKTGILEIPDFGPFLDQFWSFLGSTGFGPFEDLGSDHLGIGTSVLDPGILGSMARG